MDVLVVEDDPLVRETVACGLTDSGLEVVTMPAAEPAIELATTTGPPRVLVTDIDLGAGIDGVGLATTFAVRWPEVAVVFMTGREDRHLNDHRLGPRQCLVPKPFSLAALTGTVLGYIGQLTRGADTLVASMVISPNRPRHRDLIGNLTPPLSSAEALAGHAGQPGSNPSCSL